VSDLRQRVSVRLAGNADRKRKAERAETFRAVPERGKVITFKYFHPVTDDSGKRLSAANIIWADRDRGNAYYRVSRFAMRAGKYPPDHPAAPNWNGNSTDRGEFGESEALTAFRACGYWASCFPEGDGITLKWWEGESDADKTAEQVMLDIRDCFKWEIQRGDVQ